MEAQSTRDSDQAAADQALIDERVEEFLSGDYASDLEAWTAQFDLGLAYVHFPEGFGGLALSPRYQRGVSTRLRAAGISNANVARNVIGYLMGGPTVLAHGTQEQKERWIRPLFTAEEIWCQLFSEPGAGSDVAGLSTKAEKDGDEWVINGQKVWTTLAHTSKWGMLVARTDPEVPKHAGMTYFIVDMEQDGVEVRPLRQITGEAEFNEVYFTDARVPDANRLGEVGDGWRVALTTLMNERVGIGGNPVPRGGGAIGAAVGVWHDSPKSDLVARDELTKLWIEAEAARLTNLRASDQRKRGTPGPAGSTSKLHWAELNKRIYEFCVDVMGAEALLYPPGYELRVPEAAGLDVSDPRRSFLRSRANSIEGGTTEIMKNILGERVLGLAGEPRVDKDIPWNRVARN